MADEFEKLGGFVDRVVVSAERKVWSDKAGSHGATLSLEANVAKGTDLTGLLDAMHAYCEAYCGRALGETMAQVRQAPAKLSEAELARIEGTDGMGVGDIEPAQPLTTEEVSHVSIKKFKLTEEPNDKLLLLLFPDIKGSPGKYPEIRYTASALEMRNMMRSVWEKSWKMPAEYDVDWVAEYRDGREYEVKQGEHKGELRRYKDLTGLHTG